MTKKSMIYTKGGDTGKSSLVGGERVSKASERLDLYGELDELNSWIGVCRSLMGDRVELSVQLELLNKLQSNLFVLGSYFACLPEKWEELKLPKLDFEILNSLEANIDILDAQLPQLKNFILPGGSQTAAMLQVVRCVCRRIERKITLFTEVNPGGLPDGSIALVNRLSDYFFVLARMVNKLDNGPETLWIP